MHVCLEFLTNWLHLPILAVQFGALDSGHDFELACFFFVSAFAASGYNRYGILLWYAEASVIV